MATENITVNMENLTTEEREQLLTLVMKSNKPQQSKLWKPKKDEVYWYIDGDGCFRASRGGCSEYEEYRLDIGNCFRTKEEALFEVERLKVIRELKELADGYKWSCPNDNYCICIEYYNTAKRYKNSTANKIVIANYHWTFDNNIYFPSGEAAQKAIDTIGEERLKKYYFCVE